MSLWIIFPLQLKCSPWATGASSAERCITRCETFFSHCAFLCSDVQYSGKRQTEEVGVDAAFVSTLAAVFDLYFWFEKVKNELNRLRVKKTQNVPKCPSWYQQRDASVCLFCCLDLDCGPSSGSTHFFKDFLDFSRVKSRIWCFTCCLLKIWCNYNI